MYGKRRGVWSGARQVYNCTGCHYQHAPAIPPRQAMAGPRIRQGLERPSHWHGDFIRHSALHTPRAPWQRDDGEGRHD